MTLGNILNSKPQFLIYKMETVITLSCVDFVKIKLDKPCKAFALS